MSLLSYLAFTSFFLDIVLMIAALWFDRRSALNRWCAALALLFGLWSGGEVFFFIAGNPETLTFGYKLSAFGWAFVPPVLLSFACSFTGIPATRIRVFASVSPFYIAGLVLLIYVVGGGSFIKEVYPTELGNVGVLDSSGLWFWVNVTFSYSAFLIATILMIWAYVRSRSRRYRHQTRILLAVMAFTSLSNLFINVFLPPVWRYTAILWVIPVGTILFLIVKYRFMRLDYTLVEKEIVMGMEEAVVLIDPKLNIVKANPAAEAMFSQAGGPPLSTRLPDFFGEHGGTVETRWVEAVAAKTPAGVENCQLGDSSVHIRMTPSFDRFGDLIGGVALVKYHNVLDAAAVHFGITAREKTVGLMLMQGYSNKEIGDSLFISEGTVKTHVHNLYDKTGASNRVDLVRIFIMGQEIRQRR